jgi:hypothetical protein
LVSGVWWPRRGRGCGTIGIVRHPDPAALHGVRTAVEQIARAAPPTTLDRSAGPERLTAFASLPLDAAREAGRACAATLNDVLLAAATIALGRGLRRRGERTAWLKILVPVNVRGEGEATGALPADLVHGGRVARRADRAGRRAAQRARPEGGAQGGRRGDAVEIPRDLERGFDALCLALESARDASAPGERHGTPWRARARAKRAARR